MRKIKWIGIFAVLTLLIIVFTAGFFTTVEAYQQSGKLADTNTFYLKGTLTSPDDEKPYGGEEIGQYLILVNNDEVKITSKLEEKSHDKMFEGWLVDNETNEHLSIGKFNVITKKLDAIIKVDSWKYDLILITEKTADENSDSVVGGDQFTKPPGYQDCKC